MSTEITDDEKTQFNTEMNNGILQITSPITILELSLAYAIVPTRTSSPYKENNEYYTYSRNTLLGLSNNNFANFKTPVTQKLLDDANRGLNAFDQYNSTVTNLISINSQCTTDDADDLTASINNIVDSGISACQTCFADAPSKIFDPILGNNGALSASLDVINYDTKADLCFLLGIVIPNCYYTSLSPPEPDFDASETKIDTIIPLLQTGNVDSAGYTVCTKNAQNAGIQSLKNLYSSNSNCFSSDYRNLPLITTIP